MIEKVHTVIYRYERKLENDWLSFFNLYERFLFNVRQKLNFFLFFGTYCVLDVINNIIVFYDKISFKVFENFNCTIGCGRI